MFLGSLLCYWHQNVCFILIQWRLCTKSGSTSKLNLKISILKKGWCLSWLGLMNLLAMNHSNDHTFSEFWSHWAYIDAIYHANKIIIAGLAPPENQFGHSACTRFFSSIIKGGKKKIPIKFPVRFSGSIRCCCSLPPVICFPFSFLRLQCRLHKAPSR